MTNTPENFPSRDEFAAALESIRASQKTQPKDSLSGHLLQEIAWSLVHGPRDAEIAVELLASPRAQRLLANHWAEECPAPSLLGNAVAPLDASEEQMLLADATRQLFDLHTRSCAQCAGVLSDLERGLAALEADDQLLWTEHFASFAWQPDALQRSGDPDSKPSVSTPDTAAFPLRRNRFQELTDELIAEYQSLEAHVSFTADEDGTLMVRIPLPRKGDAPRVVQVHVRLQSGHTWVAEASWTPRYPPAGELVATFTGIGLSRPQIEDIDLKVMRHGD